VALIALAAGTGCVVKPRVCPPDVTRFAQGVVLVHCDILFSISSGIKIGT